MGVPGREEQVHGRMTKRTGGQESGPAGFVGGGRRDVHTCQGPGRTK